MEPWQKTFAWASGSDNFSSIIILHLEGRNTQSNNPSMGQDKMWPGGEQRGQDRMLDSMEFSAIVFLETTPRQRDLVRRGKGELWMSRSGFKFWLHHLLATESSPTSMNTYFTASCESQRDQVGNRKVCHQYSETLSCFQQVHAGSTAHQQSLKPEMLFSVRGFPLFPVSFKPICPPVTRTESLLFPAVTDVTFCHVEQGPCPHWTASPESNRSRSFPHLWGCNMSHQPLHAGDNFWEQRPGRWQEAGGYFMSAVKKPPCKQPGGTSSEGFTLETPQLYQEVMIP